MKINTIIREIEKLYPVECAMEWDNVGLQIGNKENEVKNILTTLTLTYEVVKEAIKNKIDLIIAHHPLILTPITSLNTNTLEGKIIDSLIKNNISLYVSHTNFDVAKNGMNDILANKLQLKDIKPLNIENNLGRIGVIKETTTPKYIKNVINLLNIKKATFIGDKTKTIKKVAIIGGSGASEYKQALENKVDLFITGDITYHKAIDMKEKGLNCLDVGHFIEAVFKEEIKKILNKIDVKINVYISKEDKDPFEYIHNT